MSRRNRKAYVSHHERFGPWQDDYPRECTPTFRLEERIAEAREHIGEERWNELQAEWEGR